MMYQTGKVWVFWLMMPTYSFFLEHDSVSVFLVLGNHLFFSVFFFLLLVPPLPIPRSIVTPFAMLKKAL